MPQKVILNRIRTMGEVIDASIQFFKQNWKPLLKAYLIICGVFWLSALAVSTINQINTFRLLADGESRLDSTYTGTYFASLLIEFVANTLVMLTTLSFMALYRDKGNVAPSVDEVWGYVKFYFLRVFGSYILLLLLILAGLVFCLVPGIYLATVVSLMFAIMVIENGTLSYSFNRAFQLIKSKWWYTFGAIILTFLLIGITVLLIIIPAEIIAAFIVFITGAHGYSFYMIAYNIAIHLGQFLYVLPSIAITLVYFSLTEQKEDVSLLERIEKLGQHELEADKPTTEEEY
ncbi:hypothetical protein [Mucilaginibacter boryungensis]|uniref:Membrane protein YesL n=1 Tax=Mucilaginibacter boryungensis TaxID=768480 RepID=A0ABR9XHX3_9SPHI|nr:hypothetical protein [Mucilaginibacter boryungensis]MBE9666856.1 hypothetical protein [Mucilaginibacter boryungensis]